MIHALPVSLHESFHKKDLGPLTYFLDFLAYQSPKWITLNQHKYALNLIDMAGLQNSTPVDTPIELNIKLHQDEGDPLRDPTFYHRLIGSLVYLTITSPDISYDVNLVSQFMTAPRYLHLAVVRWIIRYLLLMPSFGLFFPTTNRSTFATYSHANWADCLITWLSTTGWCIFLGDILIF